MNDSRARVIRGGTVVDGSGAASVRADVLIRDGRIAAVGDVGRVEAQEINAQGLLVIPGLVDPHTHYDAQVTWDNRVTPSTMNGVTTVAIGNCGIGFAPCAPVHREDIMFLMQGIEDIPVDVMRSGLPWKWQSFPQYLDFLAGRSYDADLVTQVPHSVVRVDVMGRRALDCEVATQADVETMQQRLAQGLRAGAIGFSTSRLSIHKTPDGRPIPSFGVAESELLAFAEVLHQEGTGWFQLITDFADPDADMDLLERIALRAGRPVVFTLIQKASRPDEWRHILHRVNQACSRGAQLVPQIIPRTTGVLMGFELSEHPFSEHAEFRSIAHLPFEQQLGELRRPELRERMVSTSAAAAFAARSTTWEQVYALGDRPLNYEPTAQDSIAARARASAQSPEACAYDAMLAQDGRGLLLRTLSNYAYGNLDAVSEMMEHPHTIFGLGDGGAHVGQISDSSALAFLLSYWTRDRRGKRFSFPWAVKRATRDNALALGLRDRGLVAPGYKADLNLIDYERLNLTLPRIAHDLPGGGRRLLQRCEGIRATLLSGEVLHHDGEVTAALPGRLVRGEQTEPVPAA